MAFRKFEWILHIVRQFDLPILETAHPPRIEWRPEDRMVAHLQSIETFLEAYPRVRFTSCASMDAVLFMQCATQYHVDARIVEWYSRFDTFYVYSGEFSIPFREDVAHQSCGSTMTWPRLVRGGFKLILHDEKGSLMGYIVPRVPLWTSILNAARKLNCDGEGFYPKGLSLAPWIDRRVCTIFRDGWKLDSEYYFPVLTGRLDVDLSTQSPYVMCDLVDHVSYFLQHEDAFDKADVSMFISARLMCQLTCNEWIRILSSRRVIHLGICKLVVLFLWHADRLEHVNVVADMLVERMINAEIFSSHRGAICYDFGDFAEFPLKKDRRSALKRAIDRQSVDAISKGHIEVAKRCVAITKSLPKTNRDDDAFFSRIQPDSPTPWQ